MRGFIVKETNPLFISSTANKFSINRPIPLEVLKVTELMIPESYA